MPICPRTLTWINFPFQEPFDGQRRPRTDQIRTTVCLPKNRFGRTSHVVRPGGARPRFGQCLESSVHEAHPCQWRGAYDCCCRTAHWRLARAASAPRWPRSRFRERRAGSIQSAARACPFRQGDRGATGLPAALPTVYPGGPVQRCWAHKIRNVLDKAGDAVKGGLHAITNAGAALQDRTSMDRIPFAVFTHENSTQGVPTLFSLTQNI